MNIDTETKSLLDHVFGEQLRADLAKTLGLRSALSVVMADEGLPELHSAAVSVLIRMALCNGLGEIPFGWSLLPTEDGKHELAVWVLDGVKDEMTKQLDEALN
jgi:hypothetical protein